jgi:hypothetical protein
LYQVTSYHLLEGSYFLADLLDTRNYNTYGNFPVSIESGVEIRINSGVDTFSVEISGGDTTYITYISLFYQESNILTKTGAVHFLNNILSPFKPRPSTRTFQFREEPIIVDAGKAEGTYEFFDQERFEVLSWTGPEYITYVKSSSSSERANSNDYILIQGDFTIRYEIPKILPGKYNMSIRTNAYSNSNATIQVSLDGKRTGGNLDLVAGGNSNNPYAEFNIGVVEFSVYSEHTIEITSLIAGNLIWDYVRFEPV